MSLNQFVITGDSITAGNIGGNFTYGQGGSGSFVQLVRERLGNISGLGPIVSSGFQGCYLSEGTWSFSAGWTNTQSTDAWDLGPYGAATTTRYQRYANGSTNTVTFTANANLIYPNHGFMLYYVDYTNGGNWSYSIDGGATYTNMGQTLNTNNKIGKFYVTTPLKMGDTVIIRAANSAGTGVGCAPLGIEVFYQNPATASGLIVHNLALSGSNLHELVASTSGDRLAWFKSSKITLGTNAISHIPNLGVINEQINDVTAQGDSTVWGNDLTTFYNAVSGLGPVGFYSPYESYYLGVYPQATQTAFRAQTLSSANSLGAKYISWYTELSNLGFTGYDSIKANGYLVDSIHPSQKGDNYWAERLYGWILTNFLSSFTVNTLSYPVKGSLATVQYAAKQSSVQYSAFKPISIK